MEELEKQFNDKWDNRGDIGLTKEEILQFIRDAYEVGRDTGANDMEQALNEATSKIQ